MKPKKIMLIFILACFSLLMLSGCGSEKSGEPALPDETAIPSAITVSIPDTMK